MDRSTQPGLSRALKIAVVAGAEAAVRAHIARGDDLNARDDLGRTALMIAAAKNKGRICTLLILSGADPALPDRSGRDALAIAQEARSEQAVIAIEGLLLPKEGNLDAIAPPPGSSDSTGLSEGVQGVLASAGEDTEGEGSLDLLGWVLEDEGEASAGDAMLAQAVATLHNSISRHRPVDDSQGWGDVRLFLPERSARRSNSYDPERELLLRSLLAQAFRDRRVSPRDVQAIFQAPDGTRDVDGEMRLQFVLDDIGAEADDSSYSEPPQQALSETDNEEDQVQEAMTLLEDLESSTATPYHHYSRDARKARLLTKQEEITLAQTLESGIDAALEALAAWPAGVTALLALFAQFPANTSESEESPNGTDPLTSEHPLDHDAPSFSGKGGNPRNRTSDLIEQIRAVASCQGPERNHQSDLRNALASAAPTTALLLHLEAALRHAEDEAAIRFREALTRCVQTRNLVTVSNLRLVVDKAWRLNGRGLPIDDLVQEGNLGLMKAVDRFDWRRGFRFSTCAIWWIRQQAWRAISEKGRLIRLPVHAQDVLFRISREYQTLERQTGQVPSAEAVAGRLSIAPEKVATLMACASEPRSLDEQLDGDDSFVQIPSNRQNDDAFEAASRTSLRRTLAKVLRTLKPREARVLILRYGLSGKDPLTLEQIGDGLNVTRERVRQLEANGLKKLRLPQRARVLRPFFNGEPTLVQEPPAAAQKRTRRRRRAQEDGAADATSSDLIHDAPIECALDLPSAASRPSAPNASSTSLQSYRTQE